MGLGITGTYRLTKMHCDQALIGSEKRCGRSPEKKHFVRPGEWRMAREYFTRRVRGPGPC